MEETARAVSSCLERDRPDRADPAGVMRIRMFELYVTQDGPRVGRGFVMHVYILQECDELVYCVHCDCRCRSLGHFFTLNFSLCIYLSREYYTLVVQSFSIYFL